RPHPALQPDDEAVRELPLAHPRNVPARFRIHEGRQGLLEQREPASLRTRGPRCRVHLPRSRRRRSRPAGRGQVRGARETTTSKDHAMLTKPAKFLLINIAITAAIIAIGHAYFYYLG